MRAARRLIWARGALAALAIAAGGGAAKADDPVERRFVTIGTGGVTGVYYPLGLAVCGLVNETRRDHGVRCSVAATRGSVENLRALREGAMEFGVAQSDAQAAAAAGEGAFAAEGPHEGLRAVFSAHAEPLHVMIRADAGIAAPADLRDKRVALGDPGSGARALVERLLGAAGLGPEDLARAAALKSAEQPAALCNGEIDAAIWAAGAPNRAMTEAASVCGAELLALDGAEIEAAFADDPAFAPAIIPGGVYPGVDRDVASWGPRATLLVDAGLADAVVYAVAKAVFDRFEAFRARHPAFAELTPEGMIAEGLVAALHPGAARYYRERGWM